MVADYAGLPGLIFNFLLRFEDKVGRVIREELDPVFVDQDGIVQSQLGRQMFLGPTLPHGEPHLETLAVIRQRLATLRQAAESYIRSQYQEYYQRVEARRNKEISILI